MGCRDYVCDIFFLAVGILLLSSAGVNLVILYRANVAYEENSFIFGIMLGGLSLLMFILQFGALIAKVQRRRRYDVWDDREVPMAE